MLKRCLRPMSLSWESFSWEILLYRFEWTRIHLQCFCRSKQGLMVCPTLGLRCNNDCPPKESTKRDREDARKCSTRQWELTAIVARYLKLSPCWVALLAVEIASAPDRIPFVHFLGSVLQHLWCLSRGTVVYWARTFCLSSQARSSKAFRNL